MRLTIATVAAAILASQVAPALSQDMAACADPKDSARAIRVCSEIIHNQPTNAAAYRLRGDALVRNGDFGQGLADYAKAIQINPKYAPAYESRASAYTNKGDYTHALADATKAAELAKMGQETPGMLVATPKTKTAPAGKRQAHAKQELPSQAPAFNPFQDRTSY